MQFQEEEIKNLFRRFSQRKILVIGDFALDEFITGTAERISREAPIPIIRYESTQSLPGGAANTIYNLAALGAKVVPIGVIGADKEGHTLLNIFERIELGTELVFLVPNRQTVTKTRISAHAQQSVTQQIVRLDKKPDTPIPESILAQILAILPSVLRECDAVICSDYGDGIFTPAIIEAILQHRLVIVDAQKDLQRFKGATLFTPNAPEAEREALFQQLLAQALQKGQAMNMASFLEIDEVIDPADTRAWLLRHLALVARQDLPPRRPFVDPW